MRLVTWLFLLFLGADGDPSAPTPTPTDLALPDGEPTPPVAAPAGDAPATPADDANRAGAALAPDAHAPWGPNDVLDAPEIRLKRSVELLAAGDWYGALELAVRSITDYPDQAESFDAIARIATDQLARSRGPASAGAPVGAPTGSPTPDATVWRNPGTWRPGGWTERPHPGARDPRKGILLGFDVGLNTGARIEWKAKGRTVDGVGFQASLGTIIYGGLYLMPVTQVYVDFASRSDWQFETSLGMFWSSGTPYPLVGVGAQWDPPRPIQVSLGLDVGPGVFPDVSVGFLW
jgi:hypothetical protein